MMQPGAALEVEGRSSDATLSAALEAAAEAGEDIWRFPRAVLAIPEVNWDEIGGNSSPHLLFGPKSSALKILSGLHPVLRNGVPCQAIVFTAADDRSRQVVARRLFRLALDYGQAFESLRLHEEGNVNQNGVIVMTVMWHQRDRLKSVLLASLEQDQALQRMLLRSGMLVERNRLDRRLVDDFRRRGAGVSRHFFGPRTRRYRFSDFQLDDQVNFGVGVHLRLSFDDEEILEFALSRFEEYQASFASRTFPCALRLKYASKPDIEGADTDVLWADQSITIVAGLNRLQTREQSVEYLEMVCGFDGVDVPLSESLSVDGEYDRGVTLPRSE